jgi:cysteine desulfurase
MVPYFCAKFGNLWAIYRQGVAAKEAVGHARQAVARLLGCASELALHDLADDSIERIRSLQDRFEAGALASVEAIEINGGGAPRAPNTSNVFFKSILGEALAIALDREGIAASAGAACSSGSGEPSHVLVAMGLGEMRARCSLRFSLGKQTSIICCRCCRRRYGV